MKPDEITNPRAGGPAKALVELHETDTNPSLVYGKEGGFNYGLQPIEEPIDVVQPNPSTVYLEFAGFSPEFESYGQLLSNYIQAEWL